MTESEFENLLSTMLSAVFGGHASNPSRSSSRVQCQSQTHSEFKTQVGYMRPNFKKTNEQRPKQKPTTIAKTTITRTKMQTWITMLFCRFFSVSHQCV